MSAPAETVDTLIHAGWILPMAPATSVLENHSLAIRGEQIVGLLPRTETAHITAAEIFELPGHVLMP
ncbi:MAG: TRZ/ATZ family hydrolase, partial [Haliea sp.]|nr:TRZ/ATZ family hydrolase [Haliea sp.]